MARVKSSSRRRSHGPVRMDDAVRKAILEGYAKRLAEVQNEKPIDVGVYR